MRFKEFFIQEQTSKPGYYTVGDSHAVGLANYAGSPWISKGKNGTKSDESMHYQAIDSIPKGSVVLISAGANDTFANRSPESTASSVSRLVNAATSKGLSVVYLLFPIGSRPNSDLRAKTRDAIKKSLSVPVVDLEGSRLVDGVHADAMGYMKAANQARSIASPSVSLGPNTEPGAPKTKDKDKQDTISGKDIKKGPPYLFADKKAVMDMQQKLLDLGYDVGPPGKDGKFGPYTAAALDAFKKDYKLEGSANMFTVADSQTLDKVTSGEIAKVLNPTKLARPDFGKGDPDRGMGSSDRARIALEFFIDKGWTREQAAGIVGNLQAETGVNLKHNIWGDKETAYGIAQWRSDRQKSFRNLFNKDITKSSFQEQLEFVNWEINNSQNVAPFRVGDRLRKAETAEEAAAIVDMYYERSSGIHRQRRLNNAVALLASNKDLG